MNQDDDAESMDVFRAHVDLDNMVRRHGVVRVATMLSTVCAARADEMELLHNDGATAAEWAQISDDLDRLTHHWRR